MIQANDTTFLPAEEALFLGAALAHVALYRERQRLDRIERLNRMALREWERRR